MKAEMNVKAGVSQIIGNRCETLRVQIAAKEGGLSLGGVSKPAPSARGRARSRQSRSDDEAIQRRVSSRVDATKRERPPTRRLRSRPKPGWGFETPP